MEIKIPSKDLFVKYFLQPISKISDACCVSLQEDIVTCVVSAPDNSIILNNKYTLTDKLQISEPITLNIPDIKKLIRAFDSVDDEDIVITFDKNNLKYKNKDISFKYHLLENGVINKPKINVQKINSIEFNTKFDLPEKALADIIKASTFCVDSSKIYFSTKDGGVFVELTDRTRPNVDSFGLQVSEEFSGSDINTLCLNIEIVRILSSNRIKQVHCKVNNELGVVLFDYGNKIVYTQFIVSSLTK